MRGELDAIQLNPVMIAGLYEKSLVEVNEVGSQVPEIKFLGNNVRSILILVNNRDHTFLPEDQLTFLTKILGACKLNIGDVAIVNTNNYPDTKTIINFLHPTNIILFGVEINTDINSVAAPAINQLTGESVEAKALKSKLWSGLKQMFGV